MKKNPKQRQRQQEQEQVATQQAMQPIWKFIGDPNQLQHFQKYCLQHPLAVLFLAYMVLERQLNHFKENLSQEQFTEEYMAHLQTLNQYLYDATDSTPLWNPSLLREINAFIRKVFADFITIEERVKAEGLILPTARPMKPGKGS